ncbi:hypothetical protein ABB37_02092 [Leptomonas pyrrhocoris]|uniref:BAR domain-containing protein n=1 Tax=Leptomonas pyrrhocoris TaxID=157538 RepID=A0A0N0DYB6_LEPPY|nr:hypothetical protein ABB37_02092 [Leptomonas pyrrhocoris]XP_015662372.1 hypothetical protein ABB37_02092 [Leptomonas pyrrhocoris]KPA83932.1 hypothetical protein ABB37_02092 [Leptomonas pyrrhocoris]KPA83933.1 hypothetical protein ABB37_02092 [Leptomonas pyrrhocoris]|eukprot:XP_015662371.1 hypothetical protein ABB37_02092 [Leptomonas pyrrhocoris]
MFGHAKSPSPASSNYDFSLRFERVRLFAKVLKHFDTNISRTVQAMREMAGSLSLVGQSYHEVAQCVNNTNPHSAMNRAYPIWSSTMNSNRVVESYGADLQGTATVFSGEMKRLREGEHYVAFNGSVHQSVLARLHDVMSRAKKTVELGEGVACALRKSVAAKKIVQKKEAKYVRLGKPLTASKRHAKQAAAARQREQAYDAKLRAFDAEYEDLMQRQLYVAGHSMDDFLDANAVYLAQILNVVSCLAPHGAEAVADMVNASQDLGSRLGIAPADQVANRLRSRNASTPLDKALKDVTPMRSTPSKSPGSHAHQRNTGASHNFTSYYSNRRNRGPSAEQAPPTARALDDDDAAAAAAVAASMSCWSTPGTPQRRLLSSRSPQGRLAGLIEPDPTPPPPCPNPMAWLPGGPGTSVVRSAAGATGSGTESMPVVPRFDRAVIQKPTKGVAAASAASNPFAGAKGGPLARAPAATALVEKSVTLSPGRAPFGEGNTPAFQQSGHRSASPATAAPATAVTEARSPSGAVTVAPTSHHSHNDRCADVLVSQAAQLRLACARSTEPFDNGDCDGGGVTGVVSYTARSSLQPVNLMAAMEAEADRPSEVQRKWQQQQQQHVNPAALKSSGPADRQPKPRSQKPSRNTTRRSTTLPANLTPPSPIAAANSRAAPLMASAPPPDDATLSSSTNSHVHGDSNANSFQATLSSDNGQSNAAMASHGYPLCLTTPAALKSYSNGDGWESETGGVSGRSHALSTSYALDSPAYAPHLRGMEAQSWEDSHVRLCKPA